MLSHCHMEGEEGCLEGLFDLRMFRGALAPLLLLLLWLIHAEHAQRKDANDVE